MTNCEVWHLVQEIKSHFADLNDMSSFVRFRQSTHDHVRVSDCLNLTATTHLQFHFYLCTKTTDVKSVFLSKIRIFSLAKSRNLPQKAHRMNIRFVACVVDFLTKLWWKNLRYLLPESLCSFVFIWHSWCVAVDSEFLANRTHQTRVDWSLSIVIGLLSGVVQGSGIGPVLFLIL